MAKRLQFSQLWWEEEENLCKWGASLTPGSVIVEIGTAQGGSACLFSSSTKDKDVSIYSYDICPSKEAYENLRGTGVEVVALSSVQGAAEWKERVGSPVDLIFIDGSHTLENVYNDLLAWFPFVKEGGIILFHDYDPICNGGASHFGVKVFVDALRKQQGVKEIEHVGRIVSFRKTGTNLDDYCLVKCCRNQLDEIKKSIAKKIAFDYENCAYYAADEKRLTALKAIKKLRGERIASLPETAGVRPLLLIPGASTSAEIEDSGDCVDVCVLDDLSFFYLVEFVIQQDRDHLLCVANDRDLFFKWEEVLEMHVHSRCDHSGLGKSGPEVGGICAISRECSFELVRIIILRSIYLAITGDSR